MRKSAFFPFFLLAAVFLSAQENGQPKTFTLDAAVAQALARNPAGRAARFDVQAAGRDVQKTLFQKYLPKLDFNLNTGLVPGARGDIFYSPDKQTDLDDLGIFYSFDLELVQPLYTFGRASTAVTAARELLGAEESRRDLVLENLSLEVVKAFWGLSAALKTESLAKQSTESYDELLAEIRKRLDKEDSEVDDADLLEAKSYRIDIEQIRQESIENKALAGRSFNLLLDMNPDEAVVISGEETPVLAVEEEVPSRLLDLAGRSRPEIRSLNSAIRALEAKISISKGQSLPVLFLAAGLGYARAANREDQKNPFAVDGFNYRSLGAALGLKWDPNIFLHKVDAQRSQAEYNASLEKMSVLKARVDLEVSRAFIETKRNDALLNAARESQNAAKTWLRLSLDNWEMGLGDAFRLLRAYQAYYRLRGTEIEREYEYNVSLAKLAYALGRVGLYLEWAKAGRVEIK